MVNIAPYIAKYVRLLHATDERIDIPYTQTQFGVVLMVDVAGFSTLMTKATEKGESGAEAIALEVGAYMGECIQIIEFFGGDVVKFLGDAVLVCFQPKLTRRSESDELSDGEEDDGQADTRRRNMLVRRAVECGLQLLARLSHYRVYITAEERTKHRKDNGEIDRFSNRHSEGSVSNNTSHSLLDPTEPFPSDISRSPSLVQSQGVPALLPEKETRPFLFNGMSIGRFFTRKSWRNRSPLRRPSVSDASEAPIQNVNSIDLELHIALSCGDVINIVLGDPGPSDDGTNSRKTEGKKTEKRRPWEVPYPSPHDISHLSYDGRLEYAIGGPVVESLDEALSVAKAGEMSLTPEVHDIIQKQMENLNFIERDEYYVLHPDRSDAQLSPAWQQEQPNALYLQDKPALMRQAARLKIEPLVPRIRNTSYMKLSTESNPNYHKYINYSALYRMHHSPDGNFPSQFREATIMFVSLGRINFATNAGICAGQKAVETAIKVFLRYEGILQQFAIDDKGATILGVFGLPPMSHEREAIFAAKAAIDLRDQYIRLQLADFSIALSTGIVFNAVVPHNNPFRRDPGIAGDAIILAVRMLKFPFSKRNIICDTATKKQVGGLCEFQDLGENFVKGKIRPVQLYAIKRFGSMSRGKSLDIRPNTDLIGYRTPLQEATRFIKSWIEQPNHNLLTISGSSGIGKTFFCHSVLDSMPNVHTCWAGAAEVEKGTKYYLAKNLLISVMEILMAADIPVGPRQTIPSLLNIAPAQKASNSIRPQSGSIQYSTSDQSASFIPSPDMDQHVHSPTHTRNDWLRRLASYASPHSAITQKRTPSSSSPKNCNDVGNELTEMILWSLHKCGEDECLLPLFKVVFAPLADMEENKYTKRIEGRVRDRLLCRVIVRMVQYASNFTNLILVCDDVQWLDSASTEVLCQLHKQSQKPLVVMACRPYKDYSVSFINDMRRTGTCHEIELSGLSSEETGEIILQQFPPNVHRISPNIIAAVQKRTAGNPLYVKNLAVILKDFNHVTILDNNLVPSSNRFDLDDLLGNFDFRRMIKMQFDRLDPAFQEFLTAASCMDQYFSVYEIQAVIRPDNSIFSEPSPEAVHEKIKRMDVYHFLQQVGSSTPIENDIDLYCFAHGNIPQSIYDMVSYESRNVLHRSLACYYESKLTRENYTQFLGKVTRHYLQTDWIGKQLFYLEALADLDMRSSLLREATRNLERIVSILESSEDIGGGYGQVHRSDIYRRLGICLTMRTRLNEAENYLLKSLECLGMPWPNNDVKYIYRFWVNRWSQYCHRRMPVFRKHTSLVKKELFRRVVETMMQLCNIYYYQGNGRDFILACLTGLNACERLGDTGRHYTFFLARYALLSWLNDKKEDSVYYITKATRCMSSRPDPSTLNSCALLCISAGKFSNAREILYRAIQHTRTLGVVTDCQEFYRAVRMLITMRIFEGTLDRSAYDLSLMKQLADTAHCNGDYEAEDWIAIYTVANALVKCRLWEIDHHVTLLETHAREAANYNKVAIHGILAYYYAKTDNFLYLRTHLRHLISLLPTLSATSNLLPTFGLIFATMAFYTILEKRPEAYHREVRNSYNSFQAATTELNHAFQRVKFWEFTQPCIYLARALPYISTGRTVEGFQVLDNGIFQMHYMQEIRFLKAYYWASLGRYAFTKEDRTAWTLEAKQYFEDLGIPAEEYCNPNVEDAPKLERALSRDTRGVNNTMDE